MLILDTDVLSFLEWTETPVAESILSWLDASGDKVFTTVISYEEQMRGWMTVIAKAKSMAMQVEAYRRLNKKLGAFCKMPVLDFDETAAVRFQDLKKSRIRMTVMDMKIAATVFSVNGAIVTRNVRDFEKVPGLKIADWK